MCFCEVQQNILTFLADDRNFYFHGILALHFLYFIKEKNQLPHIYTYEQILKALKFAAIFSLTISILT